MPRKEDLIRLGHMLEAARAACEYVGSKTKEDFFKDPQCQDAVLRRIEIVGEAAGKLSVECQTELAYIPWKKIINMRNRLIHAYYDINLETVWSTVKDDLPPLIGFLEEVFEKAKY
ncbi:MAG: hypothetical protein A3J24_02945 [Deltaproteobacteria bacterium RIFCSPLOWO2_02_FULL_53_8]|nr:MAG: hypothetical protein A3J24_02945 [Deltaproteobacteria bacterium RIFCSPLOWO2_02_FULL_53_8]